MTDFSEIQIALDSRLNQMPTQIAIAWENTQFTPVKDQPWARPTVMNGPSSTVNITNGNILRPGIYQVDLFYPSGKGTKDLMNKLDELFTLFKDSPYLTVGETTVIVRSISITKKSIDTIWVTASLKIIFESYDGMLIAI